MLIDVRVGNVHIAVMAVEAGGLGVVWLDRWCLGGECWQVAG